VRGVGLRVRASFGSSAILICSSRTIPRIFHGSNRRVRAPFCLELAEWIYRKPNKYEVFQLSEKVRPDWKVSDPTQRDILTIPFRRPVKPVYIRRLVRFVNAVREARDAKA
jgi:hypothetical protein